MKNSSSEKSKSVLFILPFWKRGGAEKQFRFIVEGFAEKGFDVDLILLNSKQKLERDFSLRRIFVWNLPIWNDTQNRFARNVFRFFGYLLFSIKFLLRSETYDSILSHHNLLVPLLPVFSLKANKVIFSLREANPIYITRFYRHLLSFANIITCNSEKTFEMIADKFRNVKLINNGITFRTDKCSVNLSSKIKKLGVVTNVTPRKNLGVVIKAMQRLPNRVSLEIAGEKSNRGYVKNLKKIVKDLDLKKRVRFLGYVDDIGNFYDSCDILVLPSLYEGTSNVILESIRAGKLILCSDIPENRSVLLNNYKNELLFDPQDPSDLASKVNLLDRKIMEEPKWIKSCIKDHFQMLKETYSVEDMQEKYLELLDFDFMED